MSRLLAALVGIALSASSASARQIPDSSSAPDSVTPAAGQRVRITSAAQRLHRQVGTVVESTRGAITVRFGAGGPDSMLVLARGDITRLEVSRGLRRNTGRGALLGLGVGALLGAVIGFATYEECVPQGFLDCLLAPESAGQQALMAGVAFGVIGAGVGALAGSAKQERWERVSPGGTDVGWSVGRLRHGGLGVGVGIAF